MYLTWFWIIFWALVCYYIGKRDGRNESAERIFELEEEVESLGPRGSALPDWGDDDEEDA